MSKKISINPDFFKISNTKEKKKRKKKPSLKNRNFKPNDVKKKLIARIKEHQLKEKEKIIEEKKENERKSQEKFNNEFKDTMDYLEELNKKKKKRKKNKTLKNRKKTNFNPIKTNSIDTQPMFGKKVPESPLGKSIVNSDNNEKIKDPPYGILKNGSKPTYKQWKKTLKKQMFHTDHDSNEITRINISNNNDAESFNFTERQERLKAIKSKLRITEPKKKKIKTRRIRRKITLGKHKGSIGVLVKSKKTRKIIKNEVNILKKKPIAEIKEYLRKHNLIKIGSSAPDNICRGMYENAYLSGDVYNKNTDILLHNWNKNEESDL